MAKFRLEQQMQGKTFQAIFVVFLSTCVIHCTATIETREKVVGANSFTVFYDVSRQIPLKTFYEQTKNNADWSLSNPSPNRPSWKQDPTLPADAQAKNTDYTHTGFDRGHLCPAQAFNYDKGLYDLTFLFSNAAPQRPRANQLWYHCCEKYTLTAAVELGDLTVETFVSGSQGFLPDTKVVVPSIFAKCLCHKATKKSVCFWQHNDQEMTKNCFVESSAALNKRGIYGLFSNSPCSVTTEVDGSFWPNLPSVVSNSTVALF